MRKTISKSRSKRLTKTTSASLGRYRDSTLVNLWKPAANLIRKMYSLCRLLQAWMRIWALTLNLRSISTPVSPPALMPKLRLRLTQSRNNWSLRWQTHPKIIRMICNCRFPWRAETTQCTWEHSIWAHQSVSQHALYSILGPSTWPSLAHCAMTKHPVTSSSKSMTHFPALLCERSAHWEMQNPGIWHAQVGLKQNPFEGLFEVDVWVGQVAGLHLVGLRLHPAPEGELKELGWDQDAPQGE